MNVADEAFVYSAPKLASLGSVATLTQSANSGSVRDDSSGSQPSNSCNSTNRRTHGGGFNRVCQTGGG